MGAVETPGCTLLGADVNTGLGEAQGFGLGFVFGLGFIPGAFVTPGTGDTPIPCPGVGPSVPIGGRPNISKIKLIANLKKLIIESIKS